MLPTSVCGFDILPDGTAKECGADTPLRDGWRWLHFDLADPALDGWLRSEVPAGVAKSLLLTKTRPRYDERPEGVLIDLRGVNLNPGAHPEDMVGLRIWATPTRIITIRRRKLMAVDSLRQQITEGNVPKSPSALLARLAEGLTRRIEDVAIELEEKVDAMEDTLFDDREVDPEEVLDLRQTVIKLRRFVGPQREALDDFSTSRSDWIDPHVGPDLIETANRAARTVEALDADRDRMSVVQDHIDARNADRLGRNGYVLSVIAAIFLPLGFLTGLFGVNVAGMPGVDMPWAFAALSVVSAVLGVFLYLLFRALKWL